MKKTLTRTFIMLSLLVAGAADLYAQSAIYACGHIRRTRETAIPNLKNSGYTTAILFNVNVEKDGSLTTDYSWDSQTPAEAGGIICQNGEYVFDRYQPHYVDDIKSLVTQPTTINRLEICIGGWGNGSYGNIRDFINRYGTGEETVLYKNFKALKDMIPEIVAVNNDQEQDYDIETAVKFHRMLADIGYKTTIAPYMNREYWQQLVSRLNEEPGTCEIVYLQIYGGGANNNPSEWNVFGDIPMYVGYDCEASSNLSEMESRFKNWRDADGVQGGFLWNYNSEARNVNEWATAINRIFPTKTVEKAAARFYQDVNYGGYMVTLPEGSFNRTEMALYGIRANDITSFKLLSGYKVTMYSGDNFDGESVTFTTTNPWIGNEWNDRVCSMKIESVNTGVDNITSETSAALTASMSADGESVLVSGAAAGRVGVYSVAGDKLSETAVSADGSATIPASSFPVGVYVVKAANGSAKLLKR